MGEASGGNTDIPKPIDPKQPEIDSVARLADPQFIRTVRPVLRAIMHGFHKDFGTISGDKVVHHFLPDPNDPNRQNPLVVLGSGKCGYAEGSGGCSMCSFGEGKSIPVTKQDVDYAMDEIIIKSNEDYLQAHPNKRIALVNINAIGSFFGDGEMSPETRDYIYERVRAYKDRMKSEGKNRLMVFVTEARFDDVTEERLKDMRNKLGQDVIIEIGFGVESTNDLIREAIVNKGLDPNWREKIALLKKYDMEVALHIMYGLPFLSQDQAMVDTIQSIKDCMSLANRVLLMVMNRKPGTLTDYMMSQNSYSLPTVKSVAETVVKLAEDLTPEQLRQLSVFGLVSPEAHVEAGTVNVRPTNPQEETIFNILTNWRGSAGDLLALKNALKSSVPTTLLPLTEEAKLGLKKQIVGTYLKAIRSLYPKAQIERLQDAYELFKGLDPEPINS